MNKHHLDEVFVPFLRDKLSAEDLQEFERLWAAHNHVQPMCSTVHEFGALPLGIRTKILAEHRAGPRMNDGRRP